MTPIMAEAKKYDSTVARIAGNLLSGIPEMWAQGEERERIVAWTVHVARLIVAEVKRTEPEPHG